MPAGCRSSSNTYLPTVPELYTDIVYSTISHGHTRSLSATFLILRSYGFLGNHDPEHSSVHTMSFVTKSALSVCVVSSVSISIFK